MTTPNPLVVAGRVICDRCPFRATTHLQQHHRTPMQRFLRRPLRRADVCHRHIWHGIRYVRRGTWA